MTQDERNAAIVYYVTGKGAQPPYDVMRWMIHNRYLHVDGTPTDRGREMARQAEKAGDE